MSQTERLHYIDSVIRQKGFVTLSEVAHKFEVSIRTVKRDIEYLRDRLQAPIVYVPHKRGYCYSLPFEYFAYRNERMFLFYLFLAKLIDSPTHFPFVDQAILELIKKTIHPSYLSLASRITYELEEWEYLDISLFSTLFAAMKNKHVVSIQYSDAQGRVTARAIVPEHFIHYEGKWYCIAFDEQMNDIRTFLLSRIRSAKVLQSTTRLQNSSQIREYIQKTYGIYKGQPKDVVIVRFYDPVNNIVKNQVWHKDQKVKEGTHPEYGAYVELQLPIYHPQELIGKILRYGKYAEILKPQYIRHQWLASIEEAYHRFCKKNIEVGQNMSL